MKVAHSLGWYFPESVGGTEVYVETLTRSLALLGVESVVVAPSSSGEEREESYRGVPVFRYSTVGEEGGSGGMASWIQGRGVDVYHQHSWTSGCGVAHLRAAKMLGLKTVFTVHVPGPICLRGTMMLHGAQACDGLVREIRCGACWGKSRGMPGPLAELVSRFPLPLSAALRDWLPASRVTTVLGWRAQVAKHAADLLQLRLSSDRVVAVAGWLFDALVGNGFPEEQLFLSRHGLDSGGFSAPGLPMDRSEDVLTIGFLGRWDPVKGLHVLVRAVKSLPMSVPVRLVIHATGVGRTETRYKREILQLAGGDDRILFAGALNREEVPQTLAGFDVLAVPSQWMETGPYVVLEAQSVGTAVLGSNLGGIRELVREGTDGWLVPHSDRRAWAEAITRLASAPTRRARRIPSKVRGADEVAREMKDLYDGL